MELESSLRSAFTEILESLRFRIISCEPIHISSESLHHLIESLDRIDARLETIPCEVKILTILILERHESESARNQDFRDITIFGENITKCIEVVSALRHFLVIYEEVSTMHPIFGEWFTSICLSLCNLVLMMRENEITSTHMDIDLWPEEFHITSGTLDMPTWSSLEYFFLSVYCDLYLPRVLSIRFLIVCLPEGEVSNLFLVIFIVIYSNTGYHSLHIKVSEFTVFSEFGHAIVYTPIFCEIGISLLDETIDNQSHIWNEC
jgi:hypothetical protein